jgi:hypothetical protein
VPPATATTTIIANERDLDRILCDFIVGDDFEMEKMYILLKWLGLDILICCGDPPPKAFDNAIILAIKNSFSSDSWSCSIKI